MKTKFLLLAIIAITSTTMLNAQAKPKSSKSADIKHDMKDIQHDRKDIQHSTLR